jgi:hypothetical protein
MSSELETAGAASVGALSAGGEADLSGQPCRNCGEPVAQRHCPRCGQLAASFHRPFYALIAESISDSLALDGRIARTIPLLLFRPGRLSRQYSEGQRARYVPPFRLFLLSSLLFYFVVFAVVGSSSFMQNAADWQVDGERLSADERQALLEIFEDADGDLQSPEVQSILRDLRAEVQDEKGAPDAASQSDSAATDAVEDIEESDAGEAGGTNDAVRRVATSPRLFAAAVETWAPRFSLLLVPLSVLALSLIYAWRRRIYVYDHAIHALHLHSWMYLAATAAIASSPLLGGWAAGLFLLTLPVYTMFSLRGAYGTGYFQSFLRMLFLALFWFICLVVLVAVVVAVSALSV